MNESKVGAGVPLEHPFSPFTILMPNYSANTMNSVALVASFAAGSAVILTTALGLVQLSKHKLQKTEVATALWFVLCGCIHLFFEGESPSSP